MDDRDAAWVARSLDLLRELDPEWIESYSRMTINPWLSGVLSAKEFALINVGLSAAITNLNDSALRRHMGLALHAGATQVEILEVLKMAALLALNPMSLGAPILIEEAKAANIAFGATEGPETPACDQMKAIGQWNTAWDPFYELDPGWTDEFIEAGTGIYTNGVLTPKFIELISIAFDAAVTHMDEPGTRRHIRAALALGAKPEEVMTVLKLCVSQGADALHLGVPILAEEAALFSGGASPDGEGP
jgi:alkylhydroperoxidase/carboxymuconolactone decarboxylase family protein YurZ